MGTLDKTALQRRTKDFALRVIKLCDALPQTRAGDVVGKQLLRCATSVAANYRAACRSRSRAEFVAKMGIVEEEADESGLWLEVLAESGLVKPAKLTELIREADELTAITVRSIRTARAGARSKPSN